MTLAHIENYWNWRLDTSFQQWFTSRDTNKLLIVICTFVLVLLTNSILIGQEPSAYFENSHDYVDKHDYSIICYPVISADYTVRSAHA